MGFRIVVENVGEFEQRIKDKDLVISKSIVSSILQNLIGKKKQLVFLFLIIESFRSIFHLSL